MKRRRVFEELRNSPEEEFRGKRGEEVLSLREEEDLKGGSIKKKWRWRTLK